MLQVMPVVWVIGSRSSVQVTHLKLTIGLLNLQSFLALAVETEVRMPHPSEIKENWNWLHRSSPVMWQEQPITPANDRARFAQNGIEAHEGWLKFSGGVGEGKK